MLQHHFSKASAIRSLVLAALCAGLFSFAAKTGGDRFTIYLNNKLVLQQHVTPETDVKSFSLNTRDGNDVLKIHYSHCGKTGIQRSMVIQDAQNKVLKSWQFSDNADPVMQLKVKDLPAVSQNTAAQGLHLVYSSREIPKGKVLATILLQDENKVSLN